MKRQARRNQASAAQPLQRWLRRHSTPERVAEAQALPVRRDMLTLLAYVRDNKVVGTQSTGNMPLKAIREVTARFVDPPALDTSIGDRTYKLRAEYEVWPLKSFGAVKCTYRDSSVLDGFKDLDAFEVTPPGAALLDSLVIQEG